MAKNTTHLTLRIETPIKEALRAMSTKDKRPMSGQVALLIEEAAKKRGFWKDDNEAVAA